MSYDVTIGDRDFNYTYNVSRLFYDHIEDTGKGGGLRELNGLTGRQASVVLGAAFERITQTYRKLCEPRFCALYDSPNGWGSTVGALLFLANILSACADNPRFRVRVS